jgi:glycosyltransferase involved in cell wall biosynthesis
LSSKPRILLLSTVHLASDPRIGSKIAPALATQYDVVWQPLPFYKHLLWRLVLVHPLALWQFLKYRPQVVHIFVAELLPLAFVFRSLGAKIVYEVQENLYKKFTTKTHNKGWLFERLFGFFDHQARRYFYCVFTENAYLQEYQNLSKPHVVVHNFADLSWTLLPAPNPAGPHFFYAGVLSLERALDTVVEAAHLLKAKYPALKIHLFGKLNLSQAQLFQLPHYQEVQQNLVFHGYVSQQVAFAYAQTSVAGVALLKPVGDYPDSYPTKLFDYMALGLPVVASNFKLYEQIVQQHQCGFCIDPHNAQALAHALTYLTEHPAEAKTMGENGRKAVVETYNWQQEAEKLRRFYELLLRRP